MLHMYDSPIMVMMMFKSSDCKSLYLGKPGVRTELNLGRASSTNTNINYDVRKG